MIFPSCAQLVTYFELKAPMLKFGNLSIRDLESTFKAQYLKLKHRERFTVCVSNFDLQHRPRAHDDSDSSTCSQVYAACTGKLE